MTTLKNVFGFLVLFALTVTSCKKDDDNPVPTPLSADFTVTLENVMEAKAYMASGSTGFLMPGETESFTFNAGKGSYLSFATMFVQSNDLFYGFAEEGIALYDGSGNPTIGDVTAMVELWDAGTEVNEEPGVGPNQAPRQSGPNTGPDENGTVELIQDINDGFTYPANNTVIKVSLMHDGGTEFTATIENISASATLPTPFAPGVWAVHDGNVQLFTAGQTSPAGLEGLAEDGSNQTLADNLTADTGYFSPFAPGVFVVHESGMPLFIEGQADFGDGLEALAEDGDPSVLDTPLKSANGVKNSGVFNTPTGASVPGPLLPGGTYTFTFEAEDGDYLNLATMLVHSNDLFYAFEDAGIALFDNNGNAISGDVTSMIQLWDAGTEVNEYPGAGNNQPARGGANSGADENGNVQIVNDNFTYPSVASAIKVTIEAQ